MTPFFVGLLERSSRPRHSQIPVAGPSILARLDSEKPTGESGAAAARGIAAEGLPIHGRSAEF
jgi:hypothetical protein